MTRITSVIEDEDFPLLRASTYTITRKIEIDTAHRVPHHASKCFNIHGHRYVIEATLVGELVPEGSQRGMVMDFGFIKQVMMEVIHDPADHACIFWVDDPVFKGLMYSGNENLGWKLLVIDDVPTAENLARYWYHELREGITRWWLAHQDEHPDTDAPQLKRLRVYETPNCWADYPHVR